MTTPFLVPTNPYNQSFVVSLNGTTYSFTIRWNNDPSAQNWVIDVYDINNNPVVTGIAMVTGANLLEQFDYLDFGGALIAQTSNEANVVPTYADLGSTGNLYFVTEP